MIAAVALAVTFAVPQRPTEYVTDNAGALSTPVVQQLRQELRLYEQTTKHHVIVWIGRTTGAVPLEDWTIRAAEQWKIGRKGMDDGAILFLFMRDRTVRIEVGYGLESALTDATAGQIIRGTIVPKMRAGDTDGAVQAGVNRILLTITPSFATYISNVASPRTYTPSAFANAVIITLIVLFFLGFFGVFVAAAILSKKGRVTGYGSDSSFADSSSDSSDSGGSSGSSGGSFGGGGASGSW